LDVSGHSSDKGSKDAEGGGLLLRRKSWERDVADSEGVLEEDRWLEKTVLNGLDGCRVVGKSGRRGEVVGENRLIMDLVIVESRRVGGACECLYSSNGHRGRSREGPP
jgi:hypothetical protein